MATSVALGFKIFASDNASPSLSRIGKALDGVADKTQHINALGAKVGALGSAFGELAKKGGIALSATAVAAGAVGLKTASQLEQANIAFTTMLGSGQKARAFLGSLQKFAASTPFEFPDLVQSSQQLLAMGFAAKDVIPNLTAIGDAAAGLGGGKEKVEQLTLTLGQMQAKGKIQSDELLQMTEAGVPALKILAAGFRVTTSKMQDMVTKGKVLSDKAIPILIKGLEKGTKDTAGFGGMMEKQSHTLSGMFSTLQDTVSMALANLVAPAIPSIESGIAKLTALATTMGPKIQHAISVIGPVLVQIGHTIKETVIPPVVALAGFLRKYQGYLLPLAAGILAVVAALKIYTVVVNAVRLVTEAWTVVQTVLNAVLAANPIGLIILAVIGLAAAVAVAWHNSETFRKVVTTAFHAVQAAAQAVWNWIKSNWPYLVGLLAGPIGLAVAAIAKHWTAVKNGAASVVNAVVGFFRAIPGRVMSLSVQMVAAGAHLMSSLLNGLGHAAGAVGNVAKAIVNRIIDGLNRLIPHHLDINMPSPIPDVHVPLIPNIPHFAAGGDFGPGFAVVGENGPEIAMFNGSGHIFSNPDSRGLVGGVTVNAVTNADPHEIAREVAWVMRTSGR